MIAIATGYDALDKKIEEVFRNNGENELQIVNYREFLIQQQFELVIITKNLVGQVNLESLILSLRERNTRIIYLTNEKDVVELKICFKYGIYDLIFDPITPMGVYDVYKHPKSFADIKRIFMIVNGTTVDDKGKTKDIEKLLKMNEMQHVSLLQNEAEGYDVPNKQSKVNMSEKSVQGNNGTNTQGQAYTSNGMQVAQNTVSEGVGINLTQENTRPSMPTMPSMPENNEVKVQQNTTYNVPPMQKVEQTQTIPQSTTTGGMQQNMTNSNIQAQDLSYQSIQQPIQQQMTNVEMPEEREVRPLYEEDFSKKRVIKETQIESVYQLPHDYKKTIVLLSPESTGKTTLAVNMAWYYNKKGIKTTLIDTDIKKKDIYYHFPIETAECMSLISSTEDVTKLGIAVDRNLRIYTEHKDIPVNLEIYDLVKLITASKRVSQVVIVDLDYTLDSEIIKNVLEVADNVIIVVDQKVTTLNRVPEELYTYRSQLQNVDLVVNKFYNIRHLEKEKVADFFRDIEIYNGKTFDIRVNRIYTLSDDAKSVLQGLADRTPTITIRDNLLEKDVKEICDSYYITEPKGKKIF